MLKDILVAIFVIVALFLAIIILMQEGKSAGLSGSISGAAESYWGKNKGRSMEGKLERATKILAFLFFFLAIVINLKIWN